MNRYDALIHAYASYAMSQRLPNGKIISSSDADHGFLFQHHELAREVLDFPLIDDHDERSKPVRDRQRTWANRAGPTGTGQVGRQRQRNDLAPIEHFHALGVCATE